MVAHTGIIGHDRVLVSLVATHFINTCIRKTKKLSINLVDVAMLPKADYVGSVSGSVVDKSTVFEYERGEAGSPIINQSPLTLECTVIDAYDIPNFVNFICTIDNTYVDEEHLDEQGKVNYETMKPVLFEFPTYKYLETGEVIGNCLFTKKKG